MTDRFETFATTIAQIHRCVQKIKSAEMNAVGLRSTHVMCLYALGKETGGMTSAQLCRACKEDKAAVSRSVNELAERGYVQVEGQARSRVYRAKIRLTERGTEAVRYINRRVNHVLDLVGRGMDDAERASFYRALALIAGNLLDYVNTELAAQ